MAFVDCQMQVKRTILIMTDWHLANMKRQILYAISVKKNTIKTKDFGEVDRAEWLAEANLEYSMLRACRIKMTREWV